MSNYLQRLVTPPIATPARTAQPGLQEIDAVVPISPQPAAPSTMPGAGPTPPGPPSVEQMRQWVAIKAVQPPAADAGAAAGEHQSHPAPDAPAGNWPPAPEAMAAPVESPAGPQAVSRSPRSVPPERPEQPSGAARAARTARPADRSPADGAIAVHVGSITLTVKAPAAAGTTSVAAPAARTPVVTERQQAAVPAPEGLRFSASRHHLRWS